MKIIVHKVTQLRLHFVCAKERRDSVVANFVSGSLIDCTSFFCIKTKKGNSKNGAFDFAFFFLFQFPPLHFAATLFIPFYIRSKVPLSLGGEKEKNCLPPRLTVFFFCSSNLKKEHKSSESHFVISVPWRDESREERERTEREEQRENRERREEKRETSS